MNENKVETGSPDATYFVKRFVKIKWSPVHRAKRIFTNNKLKRIFWYTLHHRPR
jgi:hypothetical protein